jgi:hypothetical protein
MSPTGIASPDGESSGRVVAVVTGGLCRRVVGTRFASVTKRAMEKGATTRHANRPSMSRFGRRTSGLRNGPDRARLRVGGRDRRDLTGLRGPPRRRVLRPSLLEPQSASSDHHLAMGRCGLVPVQAPPSVVLNDAWFLNRVGPFEAGREKLMRALGVASTQCARP